MRVLVTGASGFIGAAVVDALLSRGHVVVGTSTTGQGRAIDGLTWQRWDALAGEAPEVDYRVLDCIVHLAVPRRGTPGPSDVASHFVTAVAATDALLIEASRAGVRRLLFGSTGDALGRGDSPARENERDYRPETAYGMARAAGELLVLGRPAPPSVAVLRFFHPYGPGGEDFLVQRLMHRVVRGEAVTIEGRDGILLNPVWVEELAAGVALAAESDAAGVFHFAGPDTLTLRELLVRIGLAVGREPIIESAAGSPSARHAGLFAETQRRIGFAPRIGIDEGLARLTAQCQAQGEGV